MKTFLQKRFLFLPSPQHPSYSHIGWHLRWRLGFLRAQLLCRPCWALKASLGLGPRVTWGQRVSFLSSVRVAGSGQISIGDDTIFASNPDLYTHSSTAHLKIGKNTFLNGTRFGCSTSINIGADCILADARIMDTDFHSIEKNRFSRKAIVKTAAVVIEENVWIAAGSAILKGVRIEKDSVIAFGSVVNNSVSGGKIYAGNPAKEIGNVP